MREISTKPFDAGEHFMLDGVEYVAEQSAGNLCTGCVFQDLPSCTRFIECDEFIFKKVDKEPKLMTHRQLSEWLARGNGQARWSDRETLYSNIDYDTVWGEEAPNKCLIRLWGNDEWIKPTVDIYERDCKHEASDGTRT